MPSLVTPAVSPGSLSSMEQPILRGGPLRLRPWSSADAPALVEAYQEPEIQRWHARSLTSTEAEEWIDGAHRGWAEQSSASWAVDLEGLLAGRMTLKLDPADGTATAAYWTRDAARGQGIAPRAPALSTAWAFTVGVHRVELEHSVLNLPSCRVALKAGLALEGTRRESARHADGWHDMHIHGVIAGTGDQLA